MSDPLIGTSLGDYGLVRELGRGQSGVVYLAEHLATGLNVAVKLAHRQQVPDAAVGRRMAFEARFANQLALESVVNVFDFNDDDPLAPYLVMEYLQGELLSDVGAHRVAADEALRLLIQLADALGEAHERNIVHGGLKPSNVFRTITDKQESQAKLLPFGVPVGPRLEGEEPGDRAVEHLGAPDFQPPEQTLGAPADPRMDVYSLGAIAYFLATGRPPFSAPTAQALERAHAEVVPVAPHRVDARVSRGLSAVIMRALEKSPEQRHPSGRELAQALREAPSAPEPHGARTSTFVLSAAGATHSPLPQSATGDFVVTVPPPLSNQKSPTLVFVPLVPVGTSSPAPQKPSTGALADGFVVTSSPVPQSQPSTGPGSYASIASPQPAPAVVSSPGSAPQPPSQNTPAVSAPGPSSPSGIASQAQTQGLVLQLAITDEKGQPLGDFASSSITRAGLIVCTTGPLPPLLSRVKLTFTDLSGLSCDAQVVHHVTAEQATQWKMSPGYGVQFGAMSAEQRAALEAAHHGLRPAETTSGLTRRPDDPAAEQVLRRFTAERATDAYAMLVISKGAPFDAIRDRVRDAKRLLDGLTTRPLSLAQGQALDEARVRLAQVGTTLGGLETRMEYDAERGNFEGVARCISGGLSVLELEAARLRFLKAHPAVAGKSHGFILAGQTLEGRAQMPQALEAYADALRIDPLNVMAQQRYWAVKRQLEKA